MLGPPICPLPQPHCCLAANVTHVEQLGARPGQHQEVPRIAAGLGHATLCQALGDAGCDLDATDCDGKRAQDLAADEKCRRVLVDLQRKRELLFSTIMGKDAAQDPEARIRALLAGAKAGGGMSAESPF